MGTSTDGILFFGFTFACPEEGTYPPWENEEGEEEQDSEVFIASKLGLGEPTEETYWEAYWEKRRELFKFVGCEVSIHCSYDYPMWYVTLSNKHYCAHRGYPIEFEKGLPEIVGEEVQKLRVFCEKVGIEWQEPKWTLASVWG